ncbi:hypothetical protein SP21_20 [Salmonella phage 21]|nr:hypothetical protein SP21_20 [Salmonella phage 21]
MRENEAAEKPNEQWVQAWNAQHQEWLEEALAWNAIVHREISTQRSTEMVHRLVKQYELLKLQSTV